jgi:tRNA pseudouridine38-40 synthase
VPTWKLTIEYDGSRYSGWQEQQNARTVAGELKKAAEEIFGGRIELQGAGRTDAGVHAAAQVAHLRADARRRVAPAEILRRLNEGTPYDIAVLEVADAAPGFHARHDAIARSYIYQISARKTAFSKKFVWWIKEPLDIALMAQAAAMVAGRHDFVCFRALDPARPDESTIVVVDTCEIEEQPDSGLILFRICASHFVWRMVRRLAGTLVRVGLKQVTLDEFKQLLAGKPSPKLDVAAWTAPASGLFLEGVRYPTQGGKRKK